MCAVFQLPLCPRKPGTLSSEELKSPYRLCWTSHPVQKHFSLVQTQPVLLCSASVCGSYGAWPTPLLYCPLWWGCGSLLVQIKRGACETAALNRQPGGTWWPILTAEAPLALSPCESSVVPASALTAFCFFFGNSHIKTQWVEVFRLLLLGISHPCHLLNKNWKQTTRQIYKLEKNLELWIVISSLLD